VNGLPDAELLTVAEVAAAARVSKMTIYRLIDADVLPCSRVGRRTFRIPRQAALDLLNGNLITQEIK
jgi:excisionase family DNA binding protein